MAPKPAVIDGHVPIPDADDHELCDRDFGAVHPALLDDVRRSGRCLRCGHPVADHEIDPAPAGAAAQQQVIVVAPQDHQQPGPVYADYAHIFRPNAVPAPSISSDSPDTSALANYLKSKCTMVNVPLWVTAIWQSIFEKTTGALSLIHDRCVVIAARPAGTGEHSFRILQVQFNIEGVPVGRDEHEICLFHHFRGIELLKWISAEVSQMAKTGMGTVRETMVPQREPVTGAEDVCKRIARAVAGMTTIPIGLLRGLSPRNASWASMLWGKLTVEDRCSRFKEIMLRTIVTLALSDKTNGIYIARSDWTARFGSQLSSGSGQYSSGSGQPSAPAGGGFAAVSPGAAAGQGAPQAGVQRGGGGGRGGRFGGRGGNGGNRRRGNGGNGYGSVSCDSLVLSHSISVPVQTWVLPSASSSSTSGVSSSASACPLLPSSPSILFSWRSGAQHIAAVVVDTPHPTPVVRPPPVLQPGRCPQPGRCRSPARPESRPSFVRAEKSMAVTVAIEETPSLENRPAREANLWDATVAPKLTDAPATVPVPAGSGVPDEDWVYITLPGAPCIADIIRNGAGQRGQLNPGGALDAVEALLAGTIEAAILRPQLISPLRQALADARRYVAPDGTIGIPPRLPFNEVPLKTISVSRSPRRSSPETEHFIAEFLEDNPGAVIIMDRDGRWFHRLFLVPKSDGGYRLISDMRAINTMFRQPPPFAHPTIRSIFSGPWLYGTKMDLKSAFYQPAVSEPLSRFFGFRANPTELATYKGLPMGWAWSPFIFDLLLRPLDLLLSALGFNTVRYVDDIAVLADTPERLSTDITGVTQILSRVGWKLSLKKTFLVAATTFVFLGVRIDLPRCAVSWATPKRTRVTAACTEIREGRPTTVAHVAGLCGRLSFLLAAMPIFRVYLRPLFDATAGSDPTEMVDVADPSLRSAACFWLSPDGVAVATRWWPIDTPARPRRTWRSSTDASSTAFGWTDVLGPDGRIVVGAGTVPLSAAMAATGSAVREAQAIAFLLDLLSSPKRTGPRILEGDLLDIRLDAQVVTQAMQRGSAKAEDLVAVFAACASALLRLPSIVLRLTWIPRAENAEADGRSRDVSLADARLTDSIYDRLTAWAGFRPAVDLFATATNTRAARFYSRYPSTGSEGHDGLRALPQPDVYGYPPFALAPSFISLVERLWEGRFRFLVVLPWDLCRTRLSPDRYRFWVFPALDPILLPPPYDGPQPVPSPVQLCAVTSLGLIPPFV